jgi:hypothetical protein
MFENPQCWEDVPEEQDEIFEDVLVKMKKFKQTF